MSRNTENACVAMLCWTISGFVLMSAMSALTLFRHFGGSSTTPESPSHTSSYTSSSSGSSEVLDWDAARRAGYSEADIEAAKSYQHIDSLSNEEQEDLIIYNTLKQMGYSESEARQAAYE